MDFKYCFHQLFNRLANIFWPLLERQKSRLTVIEIEYTLQTTYGKKTVSHLNQFLLKPRESEL